MDQNVNPPGVGANTGNTGAPGAGQPVFVTQEGNRFKDTNTKGDIIIPPFKSSSASKKPLDKRVIIGIIAAAVLVVVTVIIVIATNRGSGNSQGESAEGGIAADVSAEVAESFNIYANYIISGKNSTERIPSENESTDPIIVSKIIDHDAEFMSQAKVYFDEFYNLFQESENKNAEFADRVEAYRSIVDFFYEYSQIKPLTAEDILKMKTEKGIKTAEAKIDEHYAGLASGTSSTEAVAYAEIKTAYDKAILKSDATVDTEALNVSAEKIVAESLESIVTDCYFIDWYLYDNFPEEESEEGETAGEGEESTDEEEDTESEEEEGGTEDDEEEEDGEEETKA